MEPCKPNFGVCIYRDVDTWRLRKVCIEIFNADTEDGDLINSGRMFAGPFFARRLKRRIAWLTKGGVIMWNASMDPLPLVTTK